MTSRFRQSSDFAPLKRILEPQYLLFGIALLYFLSMLVVVMSQKDNPFLFDQNGFVLRAMTYPLLLLLSCLLLLISRMATIALAMIIAGSLIYSIAYRGLLGVSYAHDVAAFSLTAGRIWFTATPVSLIVQVGLSVVIFMVGTTQLLRGLLNNRKSS